MNRPHPVRRFRKVIGSPAALVVGILLLAGSALTGNVFQGVGRADLKSQLSAANHKIDEQQDQLDSIKGEQECRSQIASTAEVYGGQLQVAVGEFVVAANARDDAGIDRAVDAIAKASGLLGPALEDRVNAVDACAGRSTPPPGATPSVPTTSTTSTTVGVITRRVPTVARSTSSTGTTSTTLRRPPATPTTSPCIELLGLVCLRP